MYVRAVTSPATAGYGSRRRTALMAGASLLTLLVAGISQNVAAQLGGGVVIGADVQFVDCVGGNNVVSGTGGQAGVGGIYISGGRTVLMSGTLVAGNVAARHANIYAEPLAQARPPEGPSLRAHCLALRRHGSCSRLTCWPCPGTGVLGAARSRRALA